MNSRRLKVNEHARDALASQRDYERYGNAESPSGRPAEKFHDRADFSLSPLTPLSSSATGFMSLEACLLRRSRQQIAPRRFRRCATKLTTITTGNCTRRMINLNI
ncbi:MAG: hypothetical protein M1298_00620 [Chloroflexi bacterium]|nr:hypothetical protein [Chloroflexota bacterium]